MNKKRLWVAAIAIIVPVTLLASTATQDYVTWDKSWNTAVQSYEPTHMVGRFEFPPAAPEDSFVTYVYSYGDIVIFSYADDNDCKMYDAQGGLVWSGTMMEDDYELITGLSQGVYKVDIPKGSSVLSGDPFTEGLGCWYAVDQYNRPKGTKLLSVGPTNYSYSQNLIVVFSYYDNTHVVIRDVDTKDIIWEGDLDSAKYYVKDSPYVTPIVFSVEASRPVSAGTFSGVVDTYAPAFNGTFTGQDFMTYVHSRTSASQDLNIIPWEDNTTVTITTLGNPADTIWSVLCRNRGEIKGMAMPQNRAIYIHADKDISVSQTPWASWGGGSIAFYLTRGIDRDGLGLGTDFFIPIEQSVSGGYTSRLHVIAFLDTTEVTVTRIPRSGGEETTIWEGTLHKGEYYRYTCPEDDASAHAIYHVTSTRNVATVGSCYDRQGSDFYPVANIGTSAISEETEASLPLDWQVLNTVGREIVLKYSNHPEGFHASVFDATGRRVDELHAPEPSRVILWGQGQPTGVYFIVPQASNFIARKVVLVR